MSLLNKVSRFANSRQGRQAINSATNGGRSSRTGTGRRSTRSSSGGGMLGKLAGGLLGGRRRSL